MIGVRSGFQALVKQVAPQALSYHCLIHIYALPVKTRQQSCYLIAKKYDECFDSAG